MIVAELGDHRRQAEALDGRYLARDRPEHRPDPGILAEHVDAEAAAVLADVREVDVFATAEAVLVAARQDLHHVGLEFGTAEVAKPDRHEVAAHAQHGRHAHGEVYVGTALGQAELEKGVNAWH